MIKVYALAGEIDLPQGAVDSAVGYFQNEGWDGYAGWILMRTGNADKAVPLFEKQIDKHEQIGLHPNNPNDYGGIAYQFGVAAYWARRAGMEERARVLDGKSLAFYEKARNYGSAAITARALGLNDKANDLCGRVLKDMEKSGYHGLDSAASLAWEFGMKERAMELAIKRGDRSGAISFANKAGMAEKANQLTLEAIAYEEKLGEDYEKRQGMGTHHERAEEAAKHYYHAAGYAHAGGLDYRAVLNFERAGAVVEVRSLREAMFTSGAKIADKIGWWEKANELFAKAIAILEEMKWYNLETTIGTKGGGPVKNYDAMREWERIAPVAQRAGKSDFAKRLLERALDGYEEAGSFGNASCVAEKLGRTERAQFFKKLDSAEAAFLSKGYH
ncbi:hypothetical protein HYU13_03660 [Candidatus Woesearchaeota archaeon]|nr:hypothetical protein [Candidatus Woesearchaeota archaeon]